jgi:hypothetical protein
MCRIFSLLKLFEIIVFITDALKFLKILLSTPCFAVIYALYKTCIDTNTIGDRQYSSTNDDGGYPSSSPGAGGWNTGR